MTHENECLNSCITPFFLNLKWTDTQISAMVNDFRNRYHFGKHHETLTNKESVTAMKTKLFNSSLNLILWVWVQINWKMFFNEWFILTITKSVFLTICFFFMIFQNSKILILGSREINKMFLFLWSVCHSVSFNYLIAVCHLALPKSWRQWNVTLLCTAKNLNFRGNTNCFSLIWKPSYCRMKSFSIL